MVKFKVKVFVNHKPIGWLRSVSVVQPGNLGTDTKTEHLVSPGLSKATTFCDEAAGEAMAAFQGPERTTSKGAEPVVTFQLCRV